ncbi:hypothetical protein [Bacillus seohaeanensis]|jgi:ssDNA-binding Zn-finger/Zn-ribbon topoisomerase 1|uniref:Uncharacterized protein n=1 Tax=Bacillus seohaeanensis TaxID=284580 RepID=A0ABW5RWK4_9BACI
MNVLKRLMYEKCPKCNKKLETSKSHIINAVVIKSCPENHFQREYHPALETYIESDKVG